MISDIQTCKQMNLARKDRSRPENEPRTRVVLGRPRRVKDQTSSAMAFPEPRVSANTNPTAIFEWGLYARRRARTSGV